MLLVGKWWSRDTADVATSLRHPQFGLASTSTHCELRHLLGLLVPWCATLTPGTRKRAPPGDHEVPPL
ncbi:hypothetical protein NDU88_008667 [Pleurodeles waltl]|uniref:Uncharacterized protein n=1 Tax=Pleurodeles waltl TaxID=8319 RepID=A0AAV7QP87_PLEWA|nr:hypothetical protein NDU88_008667 [Pleurodeles waltl]